MPAALEDIRVLDLTGSVAGAWCSRLLADYGADVVIVEPPAGHPLRHRPPLAVDGHSLLADYVLANKRSLQADPAVPDHRAAVVALAARSDVVLEGPPPASLADWGLSREAVEAANPDAVLVAITPHGLSGARAGRPGNDLTSAALSGWASINGLADREPLKPSGLVGSYVAGIAAYGAAVTALLARERFGYGQRVDVAETEAMLGLFGPGVLRSEYAGRAWERRPRIDVINTFPVPVRDGHLSITFGLGPRLRDALLALGLQDMADDPRFATQALVAQHRDAFSPPIEAILRQRDRMELFETLSTLRVIAGPVVTVDELAKNEHLRARDFFVRPPAARAVRRAAGVSPADSIRRRPRRRASELPSAERTYIERDAGRPSACPPRRGRCARPRPCPASTTTTSSWRSCARGAPAPRARSRRTRRRARRSTASAPSSSPTRGSARTARSSSG